MIINRRLFWVICCLLFMAGCSGESRQRQELVKRVKVEEAGETDSLLVRSFPGMIWEAAEVNLSFRVAGPIERIHVREGDRVHSGQLVAELDTRDYELQLQAAQAQYDQVKGEADRITELYNRKSVAVNDYDKAVSGLKLVTSQLKNAQDQLNDTRLLSPFSGYVRQVNFREGELVDAGMPLTSVIDVGHFLVEIDVPVSIYIERTAIRSFSGLLPALSDETIPLQLVSVSRKANNNQLYRLQLRLDPSDMPQVASGMDLLVKIVLENPGGPAVCIPLSALFYESGKSFVWVYRGDESVEKREVVPGRLTGDGRIGISGGLAPGEPVVVAGVNRLNENDRVKPIAPLSDTNKGGVL